MNALRISDAAASAATPRIDANALHRAVTLRDLADPGAGAHAIQQLLGDIVDALAARWDCRTLVHRSSPITTVADNYDHLHYPPTGIAREARYTRYVTGTTLLRTHTSAMIPPLLRSLAAARVDDALLACPGLVYRRDCIDRLHTGEPHQLDLWRIRTGAELTDLDLDEMIEAAVGAGLPGCRLRMLPAAHPYTVKGRQVEVEWEGEWVEVAECGLAAPAVLCEAGLGPEVSGLAMGMGLDRLLMLRKGVTDIRLLRAEDPRVAAQMLDLSPYRAVSRQPAIRRDMSIAVAADATAEELGDRVRAALAERADSVEEVSVMAETPLAQLPPQAIARLGMQPGQKNVLLRVVLRHVARSLTHEEANDLRNRIYAALHCGSAHSWANNAG